MNKVGMNIHQGHLIVRYREFSNTSPSPEFHLVSLEVRLILDNFHKPLG